MDLLQSERHHDFGAYIDSLDDKLLEITGAKITSNIAAMLYMQDQIKLATAFCNTSIQLTLHTCKANSSSSKKRKRVISPSQLRDILHRQEFVKRSLTAKAVSVAPGVTRVDNPSQFNKTEHAAVVMGFHFFDKPLFFGNSPDLEISQSFLLKDEDFRPNSMLFNGALIHHRGNKLDTAAKLFKMSKRTPFPGDDEASGHMLMKVMADNNIGHINYRQGRRQEAANHFARALRTLHAIDESFYDSSQDSHFSECLIVTLLNLTTICIVAEDYNKAMVMCQDILSMKGQAPRTGDFDVSVAHFSVGRIHHKRGDLEEAMKSYKTYLQQAKAQLGTYHPFVAAVLYSIGQVYFDQCKYQEASRIFLQSLHIRKAIFGNVHEDVANTYYSIGRTLHDKEQHGDAMHAYQKALSIQKNLFGTMHTDIVTTMCNIGRLHYKMGNLEESLAVYQEITQIVQTLLGHEHPFMATVLKTIGLILIELGKIDEAMESLTTGARIKGEFTLTCSHMALFGRQYSAASAA
mmetsp:Transcript_14560/g.21478  ORF Transcript_14560/g.21478 Transcript_14560/m.21478 type:complete len:519 (+) Transcript_14560:61-1617(+)|eukprot:CAMPEP_0195521332 /NCGR_PEP_ID=MMETSP0794_2-20130614/18460_1 /TAXON_ID=515487 /ORGANISM="Stephanopyxis turris, Strain CCMP 815" /LENGTH=518 /DNA_ID=CAMNT_0040650859 /DNA_START=61 /DNA_END=1617 /DNA_ORIENTATION=+